MKNSWPQARKRTQYISIPIAGEIVHDFPWECFTLIDRAARSAGITSSMLDLRHVHYKAGIHLLIFEVSRPTKDA